MAERPYIGITGLSQIEDVQRASGKFRECLPPQSSHQGVLGYLVSDRTLAGGAEDMAKYPAFLSLPQLLEANETGPDVLNAIHYRTTDKSALVSQVQKLFGDSGIYDANLARTVQFNMKWPDPDQLKRIQDMFPEIKMIIQLGKRVLLKESREQIVDRMGLYADVMDYVLIDPSGGTETPLTARAIAPLYRSITSEFPQTRVAIAGGINDTNVTQVLANLTRTLMTDEFGIDAESGLRKKDRQTRDGSFSIEKANEYIQRAADFFGSP